MKIARMRPEMKNYIWAGKKLVTEYCYEPPAGTNTIAEAWVLSMHKDGLSRFSTIEDPMAKGEILADYFTRGDWGGACSKFAEFPLLIKLIDSGDNLSVQVHPSDSYALIKEGQYGKTEFWYVLDADEGAGVYIGFTDQIKKDEYKRRINDGTLSEVLQFFKVEKGSNFFIPAGTVHAIGKGVTLVEVQQSSNVTYRVFDYNRVGADGKKRELQIEKALDVSELEPYIKPCFRSNLLADCEYFTCELHVKTFEWFKADSFTAITFVDGVGAITYTDVRGDSKNILVQSSETYLIPVGKRVLITLANTKALVTYVLK